MLSNVRTSVIILMLVSMVITGCLGPNISAPPGSQIVQSDKLRATPVVSEQDIVTRASNNNAFAFAYYQAIKETDGNIFFSPYSISLALAMTYAGARGETAQQMDNTLYFTLPQEKLHPAFNKLDCELFSRGQEAEGRDGESFKLNIINALWGQEGYSFLPAFLDTLAENYGAGLITLDFIKASETARITINNWISDQTENRIRDLIPQGAINSLTRLVLTNAIYFNAAWQYPFEKDATADADFHLPDGTTINIPMMHANKTFRYCSGKGYQAVELPYDGNELSMLLLLPDSGKFDEFENTLDAGTLKTIKKDLFSSSIKLTMPKYEFSSDFSLKNTLSAMGMPLAFSDEADFSGMTGKRDLHISDVLHKAFVSVDEEGTEAAAATAVIMTLTAMPLTPLEVNFNRPFIFLIQDNQTGTVLFLGRVLNPSTSD